MPPANSFDFVEQLAEPVGATLTALLLVALFALVSYFIVSRVKAKTGKTTSVALIAEILTAVGLLGLATFVGRAKLESAEHASAVTLLRANDNLDPLVHNFTSHECQSVMPRTPTKANAAKVSACLFAQKYEVDRNQNLYWSGFESDLANMSGQLFTTAPATYERATDLSAAVNELVRAQSGLDQHRAEKYLLTYNPPWLFISICFLVATAGVSLKCARAYVEYKA